MNKYNNNCNTLIGNEFIIIFKIVIEQDISAMPISKQKITRECHHKKEKRKKKKENRNPEITESKNIEVIEADKK